MNSVTNIKYQIEQIEKSFTIKDLSLIHFYSISNFVYHFDELKGEGVKGEVLKYLNLYIQTLNDSELIDRSFSNYIYGAIVKKIGDYYNIELGFKLYSNLKYELFFSLIIDFILLISGVLKRIYFIPPATLFVLCRYFYLLKYKKERKLYGYRY